MENRRLFGLMCYVNREMERRNSENLSSVGITGAQLQTLVFVHRSTMLAGLTSCGYITRSFAEGDNRTKFIELTEKGEDLCKRNRELMDKCDAIIQDALTDEEQVRFKELLIKIFNHINS